MYDPENLNCHCLLLTVLDEKLKGHSESLDQKIAAEVINTLETSSFRSFGISLSYKRTTEWQMFSFTLLSCLWSSRSKLKIPVVVYCLGEKEDFESLDDYLFEKLKIDKHLLPITAETLQYQGEYLLLSEVYTV